MEFLRHQRLGFGTLRNRKALIEHEERLQLESNLGCAIGSNKFQSVDGRSRHVFIQAIINS